MEEGWPPACEGKDSSFLCLCQLSAQASMLQKSEYGVQLLARQCTCSARPLIEVKQTQHLPVPASHSQGPPLTC